MGEIDKDMLRGKNHQGLCAWNHCNNPLNEEMLAGYGPMVVGYLCTECGSKFRQELETQKLEFIHEFDAMMFAGME